jgi:hypothetical protein
MLLFVAEASVTTGALVQTPAKVFFVGYQGSAMALG